MSMIRIQKDKIGKRDESEKKKGRVTMMRSYPVG